jgi:hypothetical protein
VILETMAKTAAVARLKAALSEYLARVKAGEEVIVTERGHLRAADSLQLAAALLWTRGRPAGHDLVCLDERLREVAVSEGFAVLP